jgi:hypothetical protein
MKSIKSLLLLPLIVCAGCVTTAKVFPAKVVKSEGRTHIVEYNTGTAGADWKVYQEPYNQAALEVCKGSPYKVLERSHIPTAFKCA